jgi:hypothetical protein
LRVGGAHRTSVPCQRCRCLKGRDDLSIAFSVVEYALARFPACLFASQHASLDCRNFVEKRCSNDLSSLFVHSSAARTFANILRTVCNTFPDAARSDAEVAPHALIAASSGDDGTASRAYGTHPPALLLQWAKQGRGNQTNGDTRSTHPQPPRVWLGHAKVPLYSRTASSPLMPTRGGESVMDGDNSDSEAVQRHTKRACVPCALASGLHVHARMRCRKFERACIQPGAPVLGATAD